LILIIKEKPENPYKVIRGGLPKTYRVGII